MMMPPSTMPGRCRWVDQYGTDRWCQHLAPRPDDLCPAHRAHVDALVRTTEAWLRRITPPDRRRAT